MLRTRTTSITGLLPVTFWQVGVSSPQIAHRYTAHKRLGPAPVNRIDQLLVQAGQVNFRPFVQVPLMAVSDRIQQYVQRLPERMQSEVLTFVEYLLSKSEQEEAQQHERDWSSISLAFAMRGMEDENAPEYSEADLKETFD